MKRSKTCAVQALSSTSKRWPNDVAAAGRRGKTDGVQEFNDPNTMTKRETLELVRA